MTLESIFASQAFTYLFVPALIFIAKIMDVTIGTIRIIFVSRGIRGWATVAAFFEIIVWLLAIGQIMRNLDNPYAYVAYAAGFAAGTYVGIRIEEKLAMGVLVVRIISGHDTTALAQALKADGHGLTQFTGCGVDEDVNVTYTVVRRKELDRVIEHIQEHNPHAFYSIEDVRYVNAKGLFPPPKPKQGRILRTFGRLRKAR